MCCPFMGDDFAKRFLCGRKTLTLFGTSTSVGVRVLGMEEKKRRWRPSILGAELRAGVSAFCWTDMCISTANSFVLLYGDD